MEDKQETENQIENVTVEVGDNNEEEKNTHQNKNIDVDY